MKNQRCKFRVLVMLVMTQFIFSCNNEDDNISQLDKEPNEIHYSSIVPKGQITIMGSSIPNPSYLGAGYDIMGKYLSNTSVKSAVIDMDKLPEMWVQSIFAAVADAKSYQGEDVNSFLNSMVSRNDIILPNENLGDNLFTQTIEGTEYDYSSQYSFTYHLSRYTHERHSINMIPSSTLIFRYLSDRFKDDLEQCSPIEIIQMYGTHVIFKAHLGSRIGTFYRSVVSGENKIEIMNQGLQSREKTIFERQNITITLDPDKVSQNYGGRILVEFKGGDFSALPYISLLPNTVLDDPMNITEWSNSLNESNFALTKLSANDLIPIYTFIEDPVKKQEIKSAVIEYIKSKQLTILKTTPILEVSDGKHNKFFTSYDDFRNSFEEGSSYVCNGIIGSLFVEQQPGTVPLYLYSNGTSDRLSLDLNLSDNRNMTIKGIIGYVYKENNNRKLDILEEISNGKDYAYVGSIRKIGNWKKTGNEFYTKRVSLSNNMSINYPPGYDK